MAKTMKSGSKSGLKGTPFAKPMVRKPSGGR